MSISKDSRNRLLDILHDPFDKKVTSTTTTKVGNNNEVVMENREDLELEVVSQDEGDEESEEKVKLKRPPIQTLVFFDVEATGLRGSTSKARITELALVAVNTADLVI
jgi:uncharacterized protein YprB with RNaseH-like and TPR domain